MGENNGMAITKLSRFFSALSEKTDTFLNNITGGFDDWNFTLIIDDQV